MSCVVLRTTDVHLSCMYAGNGYGYICYSVTRYVQLLLAQVLNKILRIYVHVLVHDVIELHVGLGHENFVSLEQLRLI